MSESFTNKHETSSFNILQLEDQMKYMQGIAKTVKIHTFEKVQVSEFKRFKEKLVNDTPSLKQFLKLDEELKEKFGAQEEKITIS